ncbi:MAG: molecular chaperone HtpG [Anaplasmataceae bacterium]|nr:molecular chaperone HtpG [Candidatus Heimdallarchaeota archaeon]MDH5796217.1 molecular chaperone HtpG [Anaplasmataceae bacterium]
MSDDQSNLNNDDIIEGNETISDEEITKVAAENIVIDTEDAENEEDFQFTSDSNNVLELVINSLYKNRDVFLRELIANASDACEKIRYESLINTELTTLDKFTITVKLNKETGTLSVIDTGIGMNKTDMIQNLGTIARSGTKKFVEKLEASPEKNLELIGQFGVGFYSAFMVADRITIKSRKAGEDKSYMWESAGNGSFKISELVNNLETHGTHITLHLKVEDRGFLDKYKTENIIKTYSSYANFPIELIDSEGKSDSVNESKALWTKSKSDITDEEHQEFFRDVAHVGGAPWMTMHNRNEGNIEYINLLYIPSIKPFDLFNPDRRCSVKLYIKKVFITEEGDLIPQYLRFVKGVVDSSDLPLNVSRETLQSNNVVRQIKTSLTNRVINELKKKSDNESEDYMKFWDNFGQVLKEGLCEHMDTNEKEKLFSICRFYSLKKEKYISLDEYIGSLPGDKTKGYYLVSNNLDSAKNSPQIEGFKNRDDMDVLLLVDHVDTFWTNAGFEYQLTKFDSATNSTVAAEDKKEEEESKDDDDNKGDLIKEFLKYAKDTLGEKVHSVIESKKLVDSPACLAVAAGGMDIKMEQFMVAQKQMNSSSAKVLELNVKHPIVKKAIEYGKDDQQTEEIIKLLFEQSCIVENEDIIDTSLFIKRMNALVLKGLIN